MINFHFPNEIHDKKTTSMKTHSLFSIFLPIKQANGLWCLKVFAVIWCKMKLFCYWATLFFQASPISQLVSHPLSNFFPSHCSCFGSISTHFELQQTQRCGDCSAGQMIHLSNTNVNHKMMRLSLFNNRKSVTAE